MAFLQSIRVLFPGRILDSTMNIWTVELEFMQFMFISLEDIVGVKNGYDEVNIQISVKTNMNIFTKNKF